MPGPLIEASVYETADVPTSNIIQMDPNTIEWDDSYQKPADPEWVAAIGRNFNLDFFLPCLVSQRDGRYFMIDGMNRREVAIKREILLPVILYPGASREREAAIFASVNHNRRLVHFYETLRAAIVAKQSWALDIERICHKLSLELELTSNTPRAGKIAAVQAVYVAYKHGNLYETLETLIAAWGRSDARVFQRALIGGVSRFLFRYEELLDIRAVRVMLSQLTYTDLLRRAANLQSGYGNGSSTSSGTYDSLARAVASEMVLLYNSKRKQAERLPDRPKLRVLPDVGA